MEFKRVIYENFVRHHTQALYGPQSLDRIRSNFTMWRYHFSKVLPSDRGAGILDIGCGDGSFVFFLQWEGYTSAAGIDVSQEQIDAGRSIGIQRIECGDLNEALANRTGAYDCIIARDVLEHLTRQEIFDVLVSIRAALRPGGSLVLQVPNGEGLLHGSVRYGDFTHELAFTRSSLQQVCLNTGFTRIECYPTGPVPRGFLGAVRWVLWQLIVLKTRVYRLVESGTWGGIFTQNLIAKAVRD